MREQLQELVDRWHTRGIPSILWVLAELKRILATEPPAVSVKAGWVAKDTEGVAWFLSKPSYREDCEWWDSNGAMHRFLDGAITDPWPDKQNGGPDCLREVK